MKTAIAHSLLIILLLVCANVSSQTVYITDTGEKYHTEDCRYLKYSKHNITLKKAKHLGYTACKVCKPPQNVTEANTSNTTSLNTVSDDEGTSSPAKTVTATQCIGQTKSGRRCKRNTKNANGRCYQH